MKANTPRDIALKVLNGLSHSSSPHGYYLEDVFRRNPRLDPRDRAFISTLVQGVLRWRLRLDWIIEQHADFPIRKIIPPVLNILRMAIYQIFFLDRVPESAAVNKAVNQSKAQVARHLVSFVNGILRGICRHKGGITFPNRESEEIHYLSVFYSYPQWLVEKWTRELGTEFTEDLLAAGNRIPTVTVRTNTLKVERPHLVKLLKGEGMAGEPTTYCPEGVIFGDFKGKGDELSSFKAGFFQVQDQAAQIMSHLLAPCAGEKVLDICAGLGGKTTHLVALMKGRGRVLALDTSHRRLISLGKNARRLGISYIVPVVADASRPLSRLFRLHFDRIMVDAPCSGLGVISRHPDGKWNRDEGDIRRLALVQRTILDGACSVLKRGGRMLYVTCTISKEENEGVVKSFLEGRNDISLEDLKEHAPTWALDLIDEQGFFKTFPNLHPMDGFFAALFIKK